MKHKTLIIAGLLSATNAWALNTEPMASHDLKIVSEHRGHFSRNYMELTSNFGKVGPGLLLSTLEYHSWSKDLSENGFFPIDGDFADLNDVESFFAPGFMYFFPVNKKLAFGPVAKYQFDDGYRSMLKAGFAGMYNHGNGLYAFAMYRFDRGMSNKLDRITYGATNVDRKDLVLGYRSENWDINLRAAHFNFVKNSTRSALKDIGHKGEFGEAELMGEYKGFKNFSPYVSVIWESKDEYANPTAFGNNGFGVGVKLHF
ncbi:hypothetical protein [Photobacterium minamisatsumaniensis]|uniref:hypothetical protein n=1 Tax=Photobacterium minamisatsumaniensis TaxID=2910233 RepID=UPI003D09E294